MAKVNFKIEGMDKLQQSLKQLGKIPQKHVTSASKKGMNIVLKDARANAPYDTGMLKKGIILAGERSKNKGKKVYRIVFDHTFNDIFQRKDASGKVTAYYPVSQEYGYFLRNGEYMPGLRFISDSFVNKMPTAAKTIVDVMKQKIDQEIAKAGLR